MDPIVIKFKFIGPEYYRYHWKDKSTIKYGDLIDGLRILFGIAREELTLVYKDKENERTVITDQFDLDIMLNSVGSHQSIKVRVLEGTIGDLREDMFNGDTIDENKGTVKLTPLAPIIHNSHPQVLDSSSSFRFPLPGLIRDGEENSSTTSLLEKDQQKTEPDSQSGPSNPPMSVKK